MAKTAMDILTEIRSVLDNFDWENDDRQLALKEIDGLARQLPSDPVKTQPNYDFGQSPWESVPVGYDNIR